MRASLEVSLPDRPTEEIAMDRALPFYIMVIPAGRAAELKGAESKTWTEEQIKNSNVGYVKLELLPRGSGRLLVRAPQLYYNVKSDEPVVMTMDLVNEGTRRLEQREGGRGPPDELDENGRAGRDPHARHQPGAAGHADGRTAGGHRVRPLRDAPAHQRPLGQPARQRGRQDGDH